MLDNELSDLSLVQDTTLVGLRQTPVVFLQDCDQTVPDLRRVVQLLCAYSRLRRQVYHY